MGHRERLAVHVHTGLQREGLEQQAWKFVLQQRDLADVKDLVSLYVLSQVIATQSADV
jgi:hypothetical protein